VMERAGVDGADNGAVGDDAEEGEEVTV